MAADPDRWADLPEKLAALVSVARSRGLDTLVLRDPANLTWLLGGRVNVPQTLDTACLDVVVDCATPPRITVVTNAIEAPRLRDTELAGLDATWDVVAWWDGRDPRLPRGTTVGSDRPLGDAVPVGRRPRPPAASPHRSATAAAARGMRRRGGRGHRRGGRAHPLDDRVPGRRPPGARAPRPRARPDRSARRRRATPRRAPPPAAHRRPPGRPRHARRLRPPARPGRERHPDRLVRAARLRRAGRLRAPAAASSRPSSTPPGWAPGWATSWPPAPRHTRSQGFDPNEWHRHHQGGFSGFQPREFPGLTGQRRRRHGGCRRSRGTRAAAGWKVEDTTLVEAAGPETLVHDDDVADREGRRPAAAGRPRPLTLQIR